MMRKKQISRMLIGAFVACMATACSNEADVLNGFPTDGNTISVNLRTNDIGAATRTIATDAESEVTSLSAYLFAQDETNGYILEKVYDNLSWNNNDKTHYVALTGIKERGPKKIYFVANGTSIAELKGVNTKLPEADFQTLLMNKMEANPTTPLSMTAQAELAEWAEGANNAIITEPAQLKRISARIDLKVDAQEGLTFVPTSIAMTATANSYIFPNEAILEDDKNVEISGTTLYPYESAAGVVKEIKVTGTVTVGTNTKAATFIVPFVNESHEAIAIERNHRYTIHITRINGFYGVDAIVTVSDWNAANASGDLQAGEALKMTATEFANGTLVDEPASTAVYPDDDSKSTTVELTAVNAKVYKIWVGSANIEAVTSWSELPDGWKMEEPVSTRTEYLWEKSYWTLTIPANDSQEAKSLTVKAVNKLELAKDKDTKKYVEITFTQEGKTGTVDHTKNPLLKWAKGDLVYNRKNNTNTIASNYQTQGSLYQWGRNYGFKDYMDALEGVEVWTTNGQQKRYGYATYGNFYNTGTGMYNGYDFTSGYNYDDNSDFAKDDIPIFFMNPKKKDYWIGTGGGSTWETRAEACGFKTSVCPEGWRMPTKADFLEIKPSSPLSDSKGLASVINNLVEVKTIKDVCSYAIRWSAETKSNKTYLRIDALVVPNDFQKGNLSNIQWDTDNNVVTRYFGANGFIHAFYHVNIVSNGQQFPVARPMPGVETHTDRLWQDYYYWTVLWDNITDYSVNNDGYYWMSDEKSAFTFNDNTRVKNVWFDKGYPFSNRKSVLGILPIDPQDCCAIRCITDNPNLQEK